VQDISNKRPISGVDDRGQHVRVETNDGEDGVTYQSQQDRASDLIGSLRAEQISPRPGIRQRSEEGSKTLIVFPRVKKVKTGKEFGRVIGLLKRHSW
jgi:hypothetical protein